MCMLFNNAYIMGNMRHYVLVPTCGPHNLICTIPVLSVTVYIMQYAYTLVSVAVYCSL